MTYHSPLAAFAPDEPARVAVLRCRDDINFDPIPLTALFAGQPEDDAEETVRRALEDIAARLDRLQLARVAGSYVDMGKPARRIAAIAGGLGLVDVQTVAGHVAAVSDTGAGVALSATMARLERCFDQAVSTVWDFRMGC